MEIKTNIKDNKCIVNLIGRLDTTTAPALESSLEETFEESSFDELFFDFDKLDYLSSAGLRVMLSCQKKMNELEKKMTIRNVKPDIVEVFEITGFTDILNIEPKENTCV